eukprot:bmy_18960T0
MALILANGEIVQDDDPRGRNTTQSRSSTPRQSFPDRSHGAPLGVPVPAGSRRAPGGVLLSPPSMTSTDGW